ESRLKEPGNHAFSKLMNLFVLYIEMWSRVLPNWYKDQVIIYDRYVWDRVVNADDDFKKKLLVLFFNHLFPKPRYVFYLYCPIAVSLERKDDIPDLKAFTQMKQRYDKKYLENPSVIAIDTAENDIHTTLQMIVNAL